MIIRKQNKVDSKVLHSGANYYWVFYISENYNIARSATRF